MTRIMWELNPTGWAFEVASPIRIRRCTPRWQSGGSDPFEPSFTQHPLFAPQTAPAVSGDLHWAQPTPL